LSIVVQWRNRVHALSFVGSDCSWDSFDAEITGDAADTQVLSPPPPTPQLHPPAPSNPNSIIISPRPLQPQLEGLYIIPTATSTVSLPPQGLSVGVLEYTQMRRFEKESRHASDALSDSQKVGRAVPMLPPHTAPTVSLFAGGSQCPQTAATKTTPTDSSCEKCCSRNFRATAPHVQQRRRQSSIFNIFRVFLYCAG
jgi:hypothetical protein